MDSSLALSTTFQDRMLPHTTLTQRVDAELVVAPMIGFVMVTLIDPAEPQVVRMETPATHMAFSGADQIAAFELVWSRMSEAALDPDESIRLLRQLIRMEEKVND